MSAEVLAAGLFPPIGDENWNKEINWQPIPVHTIPLTQEKLLAWNIPCPRLIYLLEKYRTSSEYLAVVEKYREKIKKWEQHSGKLLEKVVDVFYLHDTLFVENRKGLT